MAIGDCHRKAFAFESPQRAAPASIVSITIFKHIIMQRNGYNPCFAGGFNGPNATSRPVAHFGGGRPVQYGPCFGAPIPQPMFQPNSCFMPASALRRPMPRPNPCNAAPGPQRYDPCFH